MKRKKNSEFTHMTFLISELINKRKSRIRDISMVAENKQYVHHNSHLYTMKVYNTQPVSLTTEALPREFCSLRVFFVFDH